MRLDAMRGARIREERERLGWSQELAAEKVGVRREQWFKYEKGAEPGATVLSNAAAAGIDVLYVLTGARARSEELRPLSTGDGQTLTAEERTIVFHFRVAAPEGRKAIAATSSALAAVMPSADAQLPPASVHVVVEPPAPHVAPAATGPSAPSLSFHDRVGQVAARDITNHQLARRRRKPSP